MRRVPAGAMSATPPVAEWTTSTTTPPTAPRRTTAAGPATTLCFATGGGGACGSRSGIQPAPRWRDHDTPSHFQPALAFDHASASRRRTRLHNSDVRGAASAPGPPSTPACHAGCFRSFHIERATASRPRMRAAKPTPVEPRTLPDRYVRARSRCSSRASLPLTPQAGTPTATIGMRPATSLRKRRS